MSAQSKYQDNLTSPIPPGQGCHNWLLSTANLGVITGLDPHLIFSDIRCSIPPGKRKVSDREISDAIRKALADHGSGTFIPKPKPKPIVEDGKAGRARIVEQGKLSTEAEIVSRSPIPIPENPQDQQKLFFKTMFVWDDFIFCGDRYEPGTARTILPSCEWELTGSRGPFTIVNTFSGLPGLTKEGKPSYRCDDCIKRYPYALIEFDDLSIKEQIRFWSAANLPVRCLIHTGNKSIHAWLDLEPLNISTPDQWNETVKIDLYEQRFKPLGVDSSCSNPSRLSRLPGVFRAEKNQWQRLLWIADGGAKCLVDLTNS